MMNGTLSSLEEGWEIIHYVFCMAGSGKCVFLACSIRQHLIT